MSEHSAKRQRLTGSFSPASPPYHLAAKTETQPFVHPNTPTSPPYTSMNSQSNGGPATTATAPLSEMTPPSSVKMSQHASQSAHSANNLPPCPTPASMTGLPNSANVDSDGDAMMEDSQDDNAVRLGHHRRTNHNRQNRGIFAADGGIAAAKGVCGSQLFKPCLSTHEPSRPHATQDLFELYTLNNLARSVARTDPKTGAKINKLRKSYEGHIKAFQIAGKPKALRMDGALLHPVNFPDEEWAAQKVMGKELPKALNADKTGLDASLDSLLSGALAGMGAGPLPHADTGKFRQYLGTDDAVKPRAGPEGATPRVLPSTAPTPNPHVASAVSRASRPERAGSKRAYNDHSFQGYGEGYGDDTGDEDNNQGGMAKRRKFNFDNPTRQVEVGGARR